MISCVKCGKFQVYCECTHESKPLNKLPKPKQAGFTLLELLATMTILGILCMVTLSLGKIGNANIKRSLKANTDLTTEVVAAQKVLADLKAQLATAQTDMTQLAAENTEAENNVHDVYAVQFCPGYKVKYPTVFPEYGFCIEGQLYATYWDGSNAWTTQMGVGAYMSTSTSAPCDFRYLGNCKVAAYP